MAPDLHLDDEQLLTVRDLMRKAAMDIGEISAGSYVTDSLFTLSQGAAVNAMNDTLAALVKCTDSLQLVAYRLADYFNMVFVEFDDADALLAQWLANYDVPAPNPEMNPVLGEGGSPSIPHMNRPGSLTPPPEPPQ